MPPCVQASEGNEEMTRADMDHVERETVDLDREQQWVIHHVMVSRVERARAEDRVPPWWVTDAVEQVEEPGTPAFTAFQAWRLRRDLAEYAADDDTPKAESEQALAVVRTLEDRYESPPPELR